jgi:hypothetical protein
MTHIRKQIRDKLKTVLGATTTAGAHVFANRDLRANSLAATELPAINIENDADNVVARSIGSQAAPSTRSEQRTMTMKIAAYVKSSATLADQMDQVCLEIEMAIYADIFLGYPSAMLTTDARLMSSTPQFDESGETDVGLMTMIWEFDTWVNNANPTVMQA